MIIFGKTDLPSVKPCSVLVTGGAGYIGSHCCKKLLEQGCEPVVLDNLCNSNLSNLQALENHFSVKLKFVKADVRDSKFVEQALVDNNCSSVIHLAALKSVAESIQKPDEYKSINVDGSLSVITAMKNVGVNHIVFSSSSTVYGAPDKLPVVETHALAPENPYGETKLLVEKELQKFCRSKQERTAVALRYFNPVGADPLGIIGEAWSPKSSNLVPNIAGVALGKLDVLKIFGDHYATRDGTSLRDYLHINDLADAHLSSLALAVGSGFVAINIGSGGGATVLDVIETYSAVSGKSIPIEVAGERPGDVPAYYADVELAKELIGWNSKYSLLDMCRDDWNFQTRYFGLSS